MTAAEAPTRSPEHVLADLAELLRGENSVVSPHVTDSAEKPALGPLAACGPRAARAAGEYSLLLESVREGYLLHYGTGRVVSGADPDLALLAGDYLYALGLERLAALGDLEATAELSDLISLAAEVHDGRREPDRARRESAALWLAAAAAIGGGSSPAHTAAKAAIREGNPKASALLWVAACEIAARGGFDRQLLIAADAIEFAADLPPS
jgi:hypothetical protein